MLTDEQYEDLKARLLPTLRAPIKDRRIAAIKVNSAMHWQPPMWVEVGKVCKHLEPDSPGEEVVAIFESTTFIVCTTEHGADDKPPFFFSREDIRQVVLAETT